MADFFIDMGISDDSLQQSFSEYHQKFLHKHRKMNRHKKHVCDQLQQQALCDLELYHPELLLQLEKDDAKNDCACQSSFLTLYGLFNSYKKESVMSHNGTIFRLGSYMKDTAKVFSGWFKSSSKKERYLGRTEGLIS